MQPATEPLEVDAATLRTVVRAALDDRSATVADWHVDPIGYVSGEASTLALWRCAGTAWLMDRLVPWSAVVKVVHAPEHAASQRRCRYARRELLAYTSGLLDDLPGGLAAPRLLGVDERPGDVWLLWLEDVTDTAGRRWPLERYALAARHLGGFNGAYLTSRPMPDQSWLSREFLRGMTAEGDANWGDVVDRVADPAVWRNPVTRAAYRRPLRDEALAVYAA